jgi:hypothetical protein
MSNNSFPENTLATTADQVIAGISIRINNSGDILQLYRKSWEKSSAIVIEYFMIKR